MNGRAKKVYPCGEKLTASKQDYRYSVARTDGELMPVRWPAEAHIRVVDIRAA